MIFSKYTPWSRHFVQVDTLWRKKSSVMKRFIHENTVKNGLGYWYNYLYIVCVNVHFVWVPKQEIILDHRKHISRTGCWNLKLSLNTTKDFQAWNFIYYMLELQGLSALQADVKTKWLPLPLPLEIKILNSQKIRNKFRNFSTFGISHNYLCYKTFKKLIIKMWFG